MEVQHLVISLAIVLGFSNKSTYSSLINPVNALPFFAFKSCLNTAGL